MDRSSSPKDFTSEIKQGRFDPKELPPLQCKCLGTVVCRPLKNLFHYRVYPYPFHHFHFWYIATYNLILPLHLQRPKTRYHLNGNFSLVKVYCTHLHWVTVRVIKAHPTLSSIFPLSTSLTILFVVQL